MKKILLKIRIGSKELLPVLASVLIKLGVKHGMVVYGKDILDEVSISAPTAVAEVVNGEIKEYEIKPEDFGLKTASKDEIVGGSAEDNAKITLGILKGEIKGAKRDIVLLNSGCALSVSGKADSIADGVKLAAELIDSGKALEKLNQLIEFTHR